MPKLSEVLSYWEVGCGRGCYVSLLSLCSMVSVQLAFRIWIMCCHGQALTPWGAGLGAQLQQTPHRDPWVRGRREPLGSQGWIIENAAGAPHTGTIRQRVKENVQNIFKKKKKTVKGRIVGGSAGGIGVWNIEGEAEATTVIVAQLRHCITDDHNADSVW